ncbi:MAG: DUF2791 family P-loop domain-containing protein [Desulfobacterales bacterium]|nr:DUF2791 family P-loop domain-containing protein [Desulfobacterales bacterium]
MIKLTGYTKLNKIYESGSTVIFKAIRDVDNTPVVFKYLNKEFPSPKEIIKFKQEYEIVKKINSDGVIKPFGIEKYKNSWIIIFEDFGGETLKSLVASKIFTLVELVELFIKLVDYIGDIHDKGIVHKDINPSNILYNPSTQSIKIIDFGISGFLSEEIPVSLEGTLSYISPEQTGRINRFIDYRSDFYSLGITFYEILVKKLPFQANDAMELIHCHIAKAPPPLFEIKPSIPRILNDIVMKLISKNPEDRYQSIFGIRSDLLKFLDSLFNRNKIIDFKIGESDISDRFQIPNKLYGRDKEIEFLKNSFDHVCNGHTDFILISGDYGIGKTALANSIKKYVLEKKGHFISGKFDNLEYDTPYSGLIEAFNDLVRQILTETSEEILVLRKRIVKSIETTGFALSFVIPEIEHLIGKQEEIFNLSFIEMHNRFNLAMRNLVRSVAYKEHPLVIFLDNIHWSDISSLNLLEIFITDIYTKNLLIIGAYRNDEINDYSALNIKIRKLKKSGLLLKAINLNPIEINDINNFISDTLKRLPQYSLPFAQLCLEKTGGNPFFLNQFLKMLHDENLIKFDRKKGIWRWDDIENIKKAEFTDNVIDILTGRIQKLPNNSQYILKIASCIGNSFDLNILSFLQQKSIAKTFDDLWECIKQGIIIYANEFYLFVHQRVRRAVYSLLDENEKKNIHLSIGKYLLLNTANHAEHVFDILSHFNLSSDIINNFAEKEKIAELNLIAGRKAKTSSAFEPALNYFRAGIKIVDKQLWERNYDLALNLYIEAAEAEYLCGRFENMEEMIFTVLRRSRTFLDKIKVIKLKIQAYTAQNKIYEALKTAIPVLSSLNVNLPYKAGLINSLLPFFKTKISLMGKNIEDLENLPQMKDPMKLAAMDILSTVASAAYFVDPKLSGVITTILVNLSIKYGNCPLSAVAYASYGAVIASLEIDIESACKFGDLALRLVEKYDYKPIKAKTLFIVNCLVKHWKTPLKDMLPAYYEAFKIGLETGDFESAALSGLIYSIKSFYTGTELKEVEKSMSILEKSLSQMKNERIFELQSIWHQCVINLMDPSVEDPTKLIGKKYNEGIMLSKHIEDNDRNILSQFYFNKMILNFIFYDYQSALKYADLAEKYIDGVLSTALIPFFYYFDSLVRLSVYQQADTFVKQKLIMRKVLANLKKLKKYAQYSPSNILDKYYIVKAEYYRIKGNDIKSIDYYDEAMRRSWENSHISEDALASELFAKFWILKGQKDIASFYLKKACYGYLMWGAERKVYDLEQRYNKLLKQYSQKKLSAPAETLTAVTEDILGVSETLDISTVIKASQAISSEIVLSSLIKKMMDIVMKNAGAEKGFLILVNNQNLLIEACVHTSKEKEEIIQSIPIHKCNDLSQGIVNYVFRTLNTVVLNNAPHEGIFIQDEYVKNNLSKSILCLPIISKGNLIGILYLENSLIAGAFTNERLSVIELLSSQAAVSLENAKLYAKLKESEKQFRSLYENAVEGIFQISKDEKFISANKSLSLILGYESPSDLINSVTDIVNQLYIDPSQVKNFEHILCSRGSVFGFETQMYKKNREIIWISLYARTVYDNEGNVKYYEGSIVNITSSKQKEMAERAKRIADEANKRLKALDKMKSEFLSSVSHELRTPLTSILGFAKLIRKDFSKFFMPFKHGDPKFFKKSGKINENLEIIIEEGDRLTQLINDVLDLAKIESGKIVWKNATFRISEVINHCVQKKHEFDLNPNVRLVNNVKHDLPIIHADKDRIFQVIFNLLDNSSKFTDKGEIIIEGNSYQDSMMRKWIRICIKDTGIGIKYEDIENIFDKFHQTSKGNTLVDKPKGTGLGLYICRHIINNYGGRIWAESEMNKGSSFIFILPAL